MKRDVQKFRFSPDRAQALIEHIVYRRGEEWSAKDVDGVVGRVIGVDDGAMRLSEEEASISVDNTPWLDSGRLTGDFGEASAADIADYYRPSRAAIERVANLIAGAQVQPPADRRKFVDDIHDVLGGREFYLVLLPSKLRVILTVGGRSDTLQWNRAPAGESRGFSAHKFGIMSPYGLILPGSGPNSKRLLESGL